MADTGKADDKGAAAVRAVSSGASIADVALLLAPDDISLVGDVTKNFRPGKVVF